MAVFDTETLLADAESTLTAAVDEAFTVYFAQARRAILRGQAVTADASAAELPPNLGRWPGAGLWHSLMRRLIVPAIDAVFGTAFAAAARDDALGIHRARQTYMAQATDRLSASLWPDEAYERVRADLTEGINAGESVAQMRGRLSRSLRLSAHSYLAERIARTEAHAAVEGGSHAAHLAWQRTSGQTLYQRWIATADTRTRPSHRRASGQTVRVDEAFAVGGTSLAFPGDPRGLASETIGCRCSTLTGTRAELDDLPPSPADTLGASAMTAEVDIAPELAPTEPVRWRGILAPLETRGDYRILATPPGGQVPVNDQMWLAYQQQSGDGHDGKVTVGRIDRVWVQDGDLWGEGVFDMADSTGVAQEVVRKVRDRFAGTVSVDLSDGDFLFGFYDADDNPVVPPEDGDELMEALEAGTIKELMYVTDWRLGGATLVQDPAFHTAAIELVASARGAVTAAATGDLLLPLADRDQVWDGEDAKRVLAEAGRLGAGCFWRDDDADADSDVQADYALPFATMIDGELVAVPRGVFAVASVLQGGMGGVDLPADAQDAIRERVEEYYERMRDEWNDESVRAPWDADDDEDEDMASESAVTASASASWADRVAQATPIHPPAAWFGDPQLTGLTKVQITDEGRVYGHIADWRQRHIGIMGERVYPPRCPNGGAYPRFHRQPVRTAEGTRVSTGPLTSAGHASTGDRVTMAAAMAHYDDPRFVVANVVAGEDEFGIWVAGALRPGVEPWQVAFADTYAFSGDWRFGELVAACTVSVEGFFVPHDDSVHALAASAGICPEPAKVRSHVQDGEQTALLSAGLVRPARSGRGGAHPGINRIMELLSTGHDRLSTRMDALVQDVADVAYRSTRQAMRDERELAELAREMSAPVVAEALAEMQGVM